MIRDTIDNNGSAIDTWGNYGTSLTSLASPGIDEDGVIYLAYSSYMENYFNENATPSLQHYRHVYVTASMDGGETWLENPTDVIRAETILEPDLLSNFEATFEDSL